MSKYWNQWSSQELLSMQGVEIENEDEDEEIFETEDEEESRGCSSKNSCGNCMDCLGMSWRDFF